jgi:hypothetical protein
MPVTLHPDMVSRKALTAGFRGKSKTSKKRVIFSVRVLFFRSQSG